MFASSKLKVKELSRELRKAKFHVGEMHADLEQSERDNVMLDFKAGRVDILVATDIVARGIDIDDITMVINYDVPHDAEDYVHRVGRTARADADGEAVTFVSERERGKFASIERFLGKPVRRQQIPENIGTGPADNLPQPRREKSSKGRKPTHSANRRKKSLSHNDNRTDSHQENEPGKEKNKRRYRNKKRSSDNSNGENIQPSTPNNTSDTPN